MTKPSVRIYNYGPHKTYPSLDNASEDIRSSCLDTTDIKVLADKGIELIGKEDSLISSDRIESYSRLKKLRVLLLDADSYWIKEGFRELDNVSVRDEYIRDIKASHRFISSTVTKFVQNHFNSKSGLRLYYDEPLWRFIMTDNACFVSAYGAHKVRSPLQYPVLRYDNRKDSLYLSFKQHFNWLWHRHSKPDPHMQEVIDFRISAGGIVFSDTNQGRYYALVHSERGWAIAKGHKIISDLNVEETAIREMTEEIGLPDNQLKLVEMLGCSTDTFHSDDEKVVYLYTAKYCAEELPVLRTDSKHDYSKWFHVNDDPPVLYLAYQRPVLEQFLKVARLE